MKQLDQTLRSQIRILLSTIPGIRDANPDAVHDGRVATRRLRAVLPIACAMVDEARVAPALRVVRKTGRALGRVRDQDVLLEQVASLQQKVPSAAAAVGDLRARFEARLDKARRRLVKRIDRLSFADLMGCVPPRKLRLRPDPRWGVLEDAIVGQAEALRQDIEAASGVYFPNRAHTVRVAVKKLRYVLELMPHPATKGPLKQLRRVQQVLGQVHDRQALLDELSTKEGQHAAEVAVIGALVRADVVALHQQYVANRTEVLRTLDLMSRDVAARAWRSSGLDRWAVAAALAAPPLAMAIQRVAARRSVAPAAPPDPFSWTTEVDEQADEAAAVVAS